MNKYIERLDSWQKEVLETEGNIVLRSSRQAGKTEVISIKAAEFALKNKKKLVLVVAATERQAYLLFERTLNYLLITNKSQVKMGKDKPTKSKICLTNGSVIHCLPTGNQGVGIRGYSVDLLICDEAHYINEEVFTAVSPMLAVTNGIMILLSTPKGREGYFYDCFKDENFKAFHITWRDCPRITKEFIERERKRMTRVSFAQEYEAEFVDELKQFFPTELVESCFSLSRDALSKPLFRPAGDFYLGVDCARLGEDQSVFYVVKRTSDKEGIEEIELQIMEKNRITEITTMVKMLNRKYDFKSIYFDDAGVGAGAFDFLLTDPECKRKMVSMDNAKRSLDYEDKSKKTLVKEAMYTNLLRMMESKKVRLKDNEETKLSLRSVQYEYTDDKILKIHGKYDHIAEALVRAAWCIKDKSLNIWVR